MSALVHRPDKINNDVAVAFKGNPIVNEVAFSAAHSYLHVKVLQCIHS